MSYHCYLHNWVSVVEMCPICCQSMIQTSSTSDTSPDFFVMTSGQELEKLRAERDAWQKRYEDLECSRASCCQASEELLEHLYKEACWYMQDGDLDRLEKALQAVKKAREVGE